MKRTLITHKSLGVYIGCFETTHGPIFCWSKLNRMHQDHAVTFVDIDTARHYVNSYMTELSGHVQFPQIAIEHPTYATMEECAEAGFDRWVTPTSSIVGLTQ